VHRVRDLNQKRAFGRMHEGRFQEALEIFDRAGGVRWFDRAGQAEQAMAKQYRSDVETDPTKTRFMHTATVAAAERMNAMRGPCARTGASCATR
jgi:hypothetical protein